MELSGTACQPLVSVVTRQWRRVIFGGPIMKIIVCGSVRPCQEIPRRKNGKERKMSSKGPTSKAAG